MKNYSSAQITGSTNHRESNMNDHVAGKQHNIECHDIAMLRPRTEQVKAARVSIAKCCPIAKSLLALKKLMQEKLIKSLTYAM